MCRVTNPCKNGATCQPNGDGQTCQCTPNFQGEHCDKGKPRHIKKTVEGIPKKWRWFQYPRIVRARVFCYGAARRHGVCSLRHTDVIILMGTFGSSRARFWLGSEKQRLLEFHFFCRQGSLLTITSSFPLLLYTEKKNTCLWNLDNQVDSPDIICNEQAYKKETSGQKIPLKLLIVSMMLTNRWSGLICVA